MSWTNSGFSVPARGRTNWSGESFSVSIRQARSISGRSLATSRLPASGEDGDGDRLVLQAEELQRLAARIFFFHFIQKRMAHEGDVHAVLPVKFLLEGEDDGHPVHGLTDGVDPPLSPGPDLGADVVEDLDPVFPGGAGEREIEIRVIDQDEQIRRSAFQRGLQAAHDPEDHLRACRSPRSIPRRPCRPRRPAVRPPRPASDSPHPREGKLRIEPEHIPDQVSAVQVAGGLSGDDHDLPRLHNCIRQPSSCLYFRRWQLPRQPMPTTPILISFMGTNGRSPVPTCG